MKHFFCLFFLFFSFFSHAQLMGFKLPKGIDKVEIPFKFENNFIVVDVVFNDLFPLKFIFDTGAENTILIQREFTDLLNVSYEREFKIVGSDFQTQLTAYLARGVNMDLPTIKGINLDLLVLDQDYFRFEEYTGMRIHGILGMDLFKVFAIEIDYKKQLLMLHKIDDFKPNSKKFIRLDAQVHRSKAYISVDANIRSDTTTSLKLLLDTGASLAIMLHNNSDEELILPEKLVPGKIGNGLSGVIEGYLGRIKKLQFADFEFNNVITNFQEVGEQRNVLLEFSRNGIIGNEILSRFTVIFDFSRSYIYMRPIKKYNRGFKYDKSGLLLVASGKDLRKFIVKDLIPDSPADLAGIQVGDQIKSLNFTPAAFYDLRVITNIFQKRTGKRIRLIVSRNGLRKKIVFRLKDLI